MPSAIQYAIRAGGPAVLADVQSVAVMARKPGDGVGPPGPASPAVGTAVGTAVGAECAVADALIDPTTTPPRFPPLNWPVVKLKPVLPQTLLR